MKETQNIVYALGSYTIDLKQVQAVAADHPNKEAYERLAHLFPSNSEGSLYLYPTDRAGVAGLAESIREIEAAVADPRDVQLSGYLNGLRSVYEWSTERHWTISWKLILAAIVSVFIMSMCSDSSKEDRTAAENDLNKVKAWVLPEGKPQPLDIESDLGSSVYIQSDGNLEMFRKSELAQLSNNYKGNLKMAAQDRAMADTATIADKKKSYLKQEKHHKEQAEHYLKKFNEMNGYSWKKMHEMVTERFEDRLADKASSDRKTKFLFWLCLLTIPFYIVSQRPYGYTIMGCSHEAETLNGIHRLAVMISGGLFAAGASIGFVDIITKWSDGSTTRSDDGTGPLRLGLKIALFVAAVCVICFVSSAIMLYAAIVGLIRNYGWRAVVARK